MSRPRFLFVGGVHRSGTTLVRRLLLQHPDLSGLAATGVWEDEGQHLQEAMPAARSLGGPGAFGWAEGAHLTEEHARPGLADALWASWRPWVPAGAATVVEKSPPNLLRFRLLHALFPDAGLVALVRHPIAVALSTRAMHPRLRRASIPRLVEHWLHCQKLARADSRHLPARIELRYEALLADPGAQIERLAEGLGVPRWETTVSLDSSPTDRARARWERWSGSASRRDLARLERLTSDVQEFGYRLFDGP